MVFGSKPAATGPVLVCGLATTASPECRHGEALPPDQLLVGEPRTPWDRVAANHLARPPAPGYFDGQR
jgi:hypothetical protein